jgi:glucose dehydrogenase
MNRSWIIAALPLCLLLTMATLVWMDIGWFIGFSWWLSVLCAALLVGLGLWLWLLIGWRRGAISFGPFAIKLTAALACLDVLVPVGLVVLLWLALRNMKLIM